MQGVLLDVLPPGQGKRYYLLNAERHDKQRDDSVHFNAGKALRRLRNLAVAVLCGRHNRRSPDRSPETPSAELGGAERRRQSLYGEVYPFFEKSAKPLARMIGASAVFSPEHPVPGSFAYRKMPAGSSLSSIIPHHHDSRCPFAGRKNFSFSLSTKTA